MLHGSRPSSDKVNPDLYALALIPIVGAITESSKIDSEIFAKMVGTLGHLLNTYYFSGFYKLSGEKVMHCSDGSPARAFDDLLFSDPEKKGADVGLFTRLLIDKIAELRACLPAEKLLQEILSAIRFHNEVCPLSEAYISEKIAKPDQEIDCFRSPCYGRQFLQDQLISDHFLDNS